MRPGSFSVSPAAKIATVVLCLAAIVTWDAVAQTRRPRQRPPSRPTAPSAPAARPNLPPAAQEAAEKRSREQLSERDRRRAAAGRDAQALRRAFDASPLADGAERTLYLAGARYLEAHRWPAAQECFRELVEKLPDALWAHEASLALFDLAFEADLAPEAAEGVLEAAVVWAATVEPRPVRGAVATQLLATPNPTEPLPLQPPGPPVPVETDVEALAPRSEQAIAADVHLRAGLLAWLADDGASAREHFDKAFRLDPSPHSPIRLVAHAVVRGTPRYADTPAAATEGDTHVGQLIRYADLIHNSLEMYRAHRMWDALLSKRSRDLSPAQRSYVLFRRGHARFRFLNRLERQPDLVLKDYEASRKAAPDAPWGGETLLLAGNVAWNLKRDQAQAVALWQTLLDEYPESPQAPRAAYFIGVTWEQARDWEKAFRAFEDAQRRYPRSEFAALIDKHLKTVQNRVPRPREARTTDAVPTPARRAPQPARSQPRRPN